MTTMLAVLLMLGLMAYPLSGLGVGWNAERPGERQTLLLADGAVRARWELRKSEGVLTRNRYSVSVNQSQGEMKGFGRPWIQLDRNRTASQVTVALLPTMVLLAAALVVLLAIPRWRLHRRVRRSLCGWCGYPRAEAAVCSECGRDPAGAAQRNTARFARLVRDAAVVSGLAVAALCCAAWGTVISDRRADAAHRAKVLDYSWYLDVAGPRLTGAVMYVEPGSGPNGILNTLKRAAPGTTIVLLPGAHTVGARSGSLLHVKLRDLWLLGSGRETTTLSLQIDECSRLRFEGLTIDCQNEPFLDLRDDGAVQIRDCLVRGYNSGSGGSNAISASDSVLLVENCEFEGQSGRAAPSLHGEAFDLRGDNMFFIRGTKFIDNQYLFRDGNGVLDGCQVTSDRYGGEPYGGKYLERNCQWARRFGGFPRARPPKTFAQALDDLEILKAAAPGGGMSANMWTDPIAHDAAVALRLDRGVAFWERLLLHPNPQVRTLAAQHVAAPKTAVTGDKLMSLEEAFGAMNSRPLPAAAVLAILNGGDEARNRLEAHRQSGPGVAAANAEALLRLMDVQPPLPEQVEAAELLHQRE